MPRDAGDGRRVQGRTLDRWRCSPRAEEGGRRGVFGADEATVRPALLCTFVPAVASSAFSRSRKGSWILVQAQPQGHDEQAGGSVPLRHAGRCPVPV